LHEVFETSSHITLIFDFLAGGDLKSVFEKIGCVSEIDARTIIAQVLQSVSTLHSQNLVHMDIKSDNILLSKPDSFDNIKLCDFGLAKYLESGEEVRTAQGTLDYVPPEVLKHEPITKKSDVWSIGVLTYYLVSGYTPFTAKADLETMANIKNGILKFEEESFRSISVECIDFIKSMLVVDPELRPTVDELLQHAWLSTDI
ncbi:PREDICTED: serine/threonine-protein kinase 17A-like, partial [Nicrophorus vespilloides]|uniref:Serine/threonine-protein kinase 17A-like n=1 Tax=Nicrophorus vespilloides TaxID=110193 RepID=A0ABM1ME25_NICVS